MPLLVRLTLPRFYVQDDQAAVSAIVHNYTGTEREVDDISKPTGPIERRKRTNPASAAQQRTASGLDGAYPSRCVTKLQ